MKDKSLKFCVSVSIHRTGVSTANSVTPPWIFSVHRGLAPSPNGWTTTSSFVSPLSTAPYTTSVAVAGMPPSPKMAIVTKLGAVFGIKASTCLMTHRRNSTKTQPTPSRVSPIFLIAPLLTRFSHTVTQRSMTFPDSSASLGNLPRPSLFHTWSLILVLNGTYQNARWPSLSVRKTSTRLQLKHHPHFVRSILTYNFRSGRINLSYTSRAILSTNHWINLIIFIMGQHNLSLNPITYPTYC